MRPVARDGEAMEVYTQVWSKAHTVMGGNGEDLVEMSMAAELATRLMSRQTKIKGRWPSDHQVVEKCMCCIAEPKGHGDVFV